MACQAQEDFFNGLVYPIHKWLQTFVFAEVNSTCMQEIVNACRAEN